MEIIFFVTVATLVTGIRSQDMKAQVFKKENSLSDRKCNAVDEIKHSIRTNSKMSCLSACTASDDCKSVFYEKGNCFLCRSAYTESQATSLPSWPGSCYMYYKKECLHGWLSYKNSCYSFDTSKYTDFTDAQQRCSSINSHVLVIDDAEENEFVINSLNKTSIDQIWIGVQENNGVLLSAHDNKPVTFSSWYGSEPNQVQEPCVGSYKWQAWKWGDRTCFRQNLYVVCEDN